MRALVVSHEYPPYVFGGVATFTRNLAQQLAKNGINVLVVTGRTTSRRRFISTEKDGDTKVLRIYFPDIPPRQLHFSLFGFELIKNLSRRFDLIITNECCISFILDKLRRPIIMFYHGSLEAYLTYFRYRLCEQNMFLNPAEVAFYFETPLLKVMRYKDLKFSSKIFFVARHVMIETLNQFPVLSDKIRAKGDVLYPGIEYETLNRLYREYSDIKKVHVKHIIAFVGRLYSTKGITYAMETFNILANVFGIKDLGFWIFGEGPLQKWLKKYIKKNRLEKHVTYYGFVPREKLLHLLAKYVDVLLLPSVYEGCPYTVLEANALGIPIVTFNLPWSQEFVINGLNGYRAPVFNLYKLAEMVLKALKLNERIVSRYAEKFSIRNTIRKLLYLIHEF